MTAPRRIVALLVLAFTRAAYAQPGDPVELAGFESEHLRVERAALRGMDALVAGGAVSTAAGVGLLVSDRYDQALRVAGGVSAGFGLVNVALGAMGLSGTRRAARAFAAGHGGRLTAEGLRRAQVEDLRQAHKDTLLFAVNLGLDVGYVMAGAAAVIASRLGVDHDERWLAGGLASIAQGVFLAGIDLTLTLVSHRRHRRLMDALFPTASVVPSSGGVTAQVGLLGRF